MQGSLALKYLLLVPAILYTALVGYLSLINLADTPVSTVGVGDKVMHIVAYFGLALIWLLFIIFNYKYEGIAKKITGVCLGVIIFGTFIEVLQQELTDYRQLDMFDVLANSIGVTLAGILVWILKEILIRLKSRISLFFMKK